MTTRNVSKTLQNGYQIKSTSQEEHTHTAHWRYTHTKSLRFPKSLLNDKHNKVGQLLSEGLEGALANLLAA